MEFKFLVKDINNVSRISTIKAENKFEALNLARILFPEPDYKIDYLDDETNK